MKMQSKKIIKIKFELYQFDIYFQHTNLKLDRKWMMQTKVEQKQNKNDRQSTWN